MSNTTVRREPGPLDRASYFALFFGPVAYATGGYGLLYLFGLPDSSVVGLVCATGLGSVLGLLLCMEELLEASRWHGGSVASGSDAGHPGTTAGAASPVRLEAGADAGGDQRRLCRPTGRGGEPLLLPACLRPVAVLPSRGFAGGGTHLSAAETPPEIGFGRLSSSPKAASRAPHPGAPRGRSATG